MKNLSERQKDILILLVVIIVSCPISYFMTELGFLTFPKPISYLWYLLLIFVCFFSYLESRDKDPFVTGKTERMGVSNSFTASAFLIGFMSKWFTGWLINALLVSVCLFISRELGRYSYRKRKNK